MSYEDGQRNTGSSSNRNLLQGDAVYAVEHGMDAESGRSERKRNIYQF